jgi:tetratricopeptide (TPR) repeat protein
MTTTSSEHPLDVAEALALAVEAYQGDDNLGVFLDRLRHLARSASPESLIQAAEPYRDAPEVVIPLYEQVVASRPDDARAMVVLANAYWLSGRGPETVGELASRALAVDPSNRAAWHLWALAESAVRQRVERWQQVAERFPDDQLARAALADNAASLAGAERDPLALDLAIETYQGLLGEATAPAQRRALENAIKTLRGWRV